LTNPIEYDIINAETRKEQKKMLYMLGQIVLDLRKDLIPTYLIKVGLSRDVDRRMNNYRSHNPSAMLISTTAGVEYEEYNCHFFLSRNGCHCYDGEWYSVSKDFFVKCLKEGFEFFPKQRKNQNVYKHISSIKINEICNKIIA
jgi:hypothetical protein